MIVWHFREKGFYLSPCYATLISGYFHTLSWHDKIPTPYHLIFQWVNSWLDRKAAVPVMKSKKPEFLYFHPWISVPHVERYKIPKVVGLPAFPCRLNPCGPQRGVARVLGGRWVLAFPSFHVYGAAQGGGQAGRLGGSLRGLPWDFILEGTPGAVPVGAVGREPQGRSCCLKLGLQEGFFALLCPPEPTASPWTCKAPRAPCSGGYLCLQRHLSSAACTHRTGAGGSWSYQGLHEGVVGNFIVEARRWLQSIINQTSCDSNHTSLFNMVTLCCCLKL